METAPAKAAAAGTETHGFLDFLKGVIDIINPLQHIPVVSAIYRRLTGDEIGPMARIAGDALFGGPVGAAVGIADTVLKQSTGKDMGETAFAMLTGPEKDKGTMIAANTRDASGIVWNTPEITPEKGTQTAQAVPRELVAARMMDALDKYKALKTAEFRPTVSAVF